MPHNPAKLEVIDRANALVIAVHVLADRHRRRLAEASPGLRNQLVRAVTSISLNLSEGCGYPTPSKTAAFLDIAIGSCNEVERVLTLCQQLNLFQDKSADALIEDVQRVRRMTYGFRKRILNASASESTKPEGPSASDIGPAERSKSGPPEARPPNSDRRPDSHSP